MLKGSDSVTGSQGFCYFKGKVSAEISLSVQGGGGAAHGELNASE